MKTESVVIMPINKQDMKELMKETKETLATGKFTAAGKTFAEVDMWRIRKKIRTSSSIRRRLM